MRSQRCRNRLPTTVTALRSMANTTPRRLRPSRPSSAISGPTASTAPPTRRLAVPCRICLPIAVATAPWPPAPAPPCCSPPHDGVQVRHHELTDDLEVHTSGVSVGRTAAPAKPKGCRGGKSGLHGRAVPDNVRRVRAQGQCHREQTAAVRSVCRGKGETVRDRKSVV